LYSTMEMETRFLAFLFTILLFPMELVEALEYLSSLKIFFCIYFDLSCKCFARQLDRQNSTKLIEFTLLIEVTNYSPLTNAIENVWPKYLA
jgi:hypothetical protein